MKRQLNRSTVQHCTCQFFIWDIPVFLHQVFDLSQNPVQFWRGIRPQFSRLWKRWHSLHNLSEGKIQALTKYTPMANTETLLLCQENARHKYFITSTWKSSQTFPFLGISSKYNLLYKPEQSAHIRSCRSANCLFSVVKFSFGKPCMTTLADRPEHRTNQGNKEEKKLCPRKKRELIEVLIIRVHLPGTAHSCKTSEHLWLFLEININISFKQNTNHSL